ncbi:MAG: hypothetical protein DRR19_18640 [Candidatus Parabeggiatoa sp. nov. 1]|nr:MAG: hypothetical protein DRR19_18640 [Gammaproteobacteria bacterium]
MCTKITPGVGYYFGCEAITDLQPVPKHFDLVVVTMKRCRRGSPPCPTCVRSYDTPPNET